MFIIVKYEAVYRLFSLPDITAILFFILAKKISYTTTACNAHVMAHPMHHIGRSVALSNAQFTWKFDNLHAIAKPYRFGKPVIYVVNCNFVGFSIDGYILHLS